MNDQKRLGAYYTPQEIADALASWAIRDPDDLVLDPSFGGGAMLRSAVRMLSRLGASFPGAQIFGVDIDPSAQTLVSDLKTEKATTNRFVTGDFFSLDKESLPHNKFSVILGNPPYIPHQRLSTGQMSAAHSRLVEFDLELSRRASYWAPFLLYSMNLLVEGGRLGMVLPGALIQSDYGSQVVEALKSHFSIIHLVLVQERLFRGVEEESLLLLADGAGGEFQELRITSVSNSSELDGAFPSILQHSTRIVGTNEDGEWLRWKINERASRIYDRAINNGIALRLGELVKIDLGVVTGNNDFFTITPQQARAWQVPRQYLVPVVRRAKELSRLMYSQHDLDRDMDDESRGHFLLAIPRGSDDLPDGVRRYIKQGIVDKVHQATKCKERHPWYSVPAVFSPAAFMPCMTSSGHNLVLNQTQATCTNNIFRLSNKEGDHGVELNALAVGVLSTLTALSAELVGRSYGGGVLKLEPSEMAQLVIPKIPSPEAKKSFAQLDKLLRLGKREDATRIVDNLVSGHLSLSEAEIEALRRAVVALRSRRKGKPERAQ